MRYIEKRTALLAVFLAAFGVSLAGLSGYCLEYRAQERTYKEAAARYSKVLSAPEKIPAESGNKEPLSESAAGGKDGHCPIAVDFDALLAQNGDIVGWLYCAGTNINYPLVQGEDNDYYLHHAYDGTKSRAGAIFVDAENRPDFADSNTILYGHHMKNGSMFAHLADFADQEFFDAHSVMWLLTPEQIYKVELLGGYLTNADSDSYMIFSGACAEFDGYLAGVRAASDVQAKVQAPRDGRCIMLSTCEYDFEDARYVLHGLLVPVEGRA